MINQQIKDKLSLSGISAHHDDSFMHNCEIFLWREVCRKDCEVYIMDWDMAEGKPLKSGMLRIVIVLIAGGRKMTRRFDLTEDSFISTLEFTKNMVNYEISKGELI